MGNIFKKAKRFFTSGTILASLGSLAAGLDQASALILQVQPVLSPKAAAVSITVLSGIAIVRRVLADSKIIGLF